MSHSKELYWFYKPCSEVLHAETKSHYRFTGKAFLYPFLAAIKLYGPLYLATHIVGRKGVQTILTKLVPAIVRSSAFLFFAVKSAQFFYRNGAWNSFYFMFSPQIQKLRLLTLLLLAVYGGLFVTFQCLLLGLTRRAYRIYFFGSFFVAALISIFIEHRGRRPELAVYVFNVGMETIFRMMVSRGYIKPIKHSMGILFAASWAALSYYQKHKPGYLSSVGNIVKFLNGEEGKPALLERKLSGSSLDQFDESSSSEEMLCPHHKHGIRCGVHWIANFSQSFLFGYGLKGLLALVSNLMRVKGLSGEKLRQIIVKSFGSQQIRFGLFLGCLSALSRFVSCILRITRRKDDSINTIVAGFIAGLSSYLSSSLEISMYIFAKAIQTIYNHLASLNKIKAPKYGTELLYSFFTALVFYAGIWEPHNIRPSYKSFLSKITGGLYDEYIRCNKGLRAEFESSAWYAKSLWK